MAIRASILKSPWVLLLGATVLAAGIAYIAYLYLQQRETRLQEEMTARSARARGPKTAVVVPRADAKPGQTVDLGVFVSREIDADLVYPDTVSTADFEAVRGQRLARGVLKGRPLRLSDLQAPEVKDVAGILPEGLRAVTIDIDNVNSIAQTLKPGHHVDVFLVSKIEPAKGVEMPEGQRQQVAVFMQNLKVIATGKEFQNVDPAQMARTEKMVRPGDMRREGENFDSVTLLVSPAEAQRLVLGTKVGTYRVALRGKSDEARISVPPLMAGDLLASSGGSQERRIEYIVGGRQGAAPANLMPTMVPIGPATSSAATAARGSSGNGGGWGSSGSDPQSNKGAMSQAVRDTTASARHVGSAADEAMNK